MKKLLVVFVSLIIATLSMASYGAKGNVEINLSCENVENNRLFDVSVSDKSGDFQITIGLIKTLIFYVDLAMLERLILPLKYDRIAKAIGFVQTDSAYELKMSEYQKKCECL